jgi:hypothetical protein
MPSGSSSRNRDAQRKAAEMLRAQRLRERRRRILSWSIGTAVIVIAAAAITSVIVLNAKTATTSAADTSTTAPTVARGARSAPPWNAPGDPTARAKAAGLSMLSAEGTVEHIHSHLSLSVNGRAVTVPALLGIDQRANTISPLHTHDTSGIVHVESPVRATFTLGQVFTEWNVALDATHLGSYTSGGDTTITTFVDGKKFTGDPASIVLVDHEDIDIVVAPSSQTVTAPAAFTWPAGY